ncbi:hypothetical protein B9G69_011080 [Bdellovibrio sp. SKB1291214]|uniref:hypothetical protein n=1 Tax=Bdellovibrio sp. SKB1291214 TaxID=1732569 RepID=UPI000B51E05B|nr:hypothetical protein [Bdellovibrio sp. SKB1291214]UYL07588.1 hypothetical protein B9G69_011080 [Bdellovibrio sp. SKB1291214]
MTNKRSELILKLYGVFSGCLILYIAYYLATHTSPIKQKADGNENKKYPVIGRIVFLEGDVRVRLAGELLWLPGKINDLIHDNDNVFTGSNGKVHVYLMQATNLYITKDSLVRITRRNNLNTIHLEEGEVQMTSAADEAAALQVNDRARLLKLTGVEEKVSYQGERNRQRLKKVELAQAPAESFSEAQSDIPQDQSPLDPLPPEEILERNSAEAAATVEQKKVSLDDETTQSFVIWLAIGYGVFSLLAVKEFVAMRKTEDS